jgi:hypothetical protein
MTALGPGEIRAHKRPFVVLGVAGLRIFSGFCLAWPLGSLVSNSGVGLRAEGDRALFEGGGYLLLDLVRLQGSPLMAVVRGLVPLLLLGLLLTAACNAALLVALNARERLKSLDWLSRAWARLPALVVLGAGAAFTQLVVVTAGALGSGGIPESLSRPRLTTALQGLVWLVTLVVVSAIGGFSDSSKAALVRYETRLTEGLARAWRCLLRRPFQACFGWFPYGLAFLAAALLASKLTEALDVSRSGAWRVVAVLVVHQLLIVSSVALRAAWFARALRFVAVHC